MSSTSKFGVALLTAWAFLGAPRMAAADPVAIDFGISGFPNFTIRGTGTVVVDSSLLFPGSSSINLADLLFFSLSVSDIPGVPSSTTFSKSDLSGWIITVVGSSFDPTNFAIEVLNFFMLDHPANADGYSIHAGGEHVLFLCEGPVVQPACGNSFPHPTLGIADIAVGRPRDVPETGSMTLLGIGLAGVALKARHRRRVRTCRT